MFEATDSSIGPSDLTLFGPTDPPDPAGGQAGKPTDETAGVGSTRIR
jgi:hypothetical protein